MSVPNIIFSLSLFRHYMQPQINKQYKKRKLQPIRKRTKQKTKQKQTRRHRQLVDNKNDWVFSIHPAA